MQPVCLEDRVAICFLEEHTPQEPHPIVKSSDRKELSHFEPPCCLARGGTVDLVVPHLGSNQWRRDETPKEEEGHELRGQVK